MGPGFASQACSCCYWLTLNLYCCVLFQTGLRALPAGCGALFGTDNGVNAESAIRDLAKRYSSDLRQRVSVELPLLPFSR